MASPKSLPFDRVRVMIDAQTGLYRRPEERRAVPGLRPGPQMLWRQPAKAPAAAELSGPALGDAVELAGGELLEPLVVDTAGPQKPAPDEGAMADEADADIATWVGQADGAQSRRPELRQRQAEAPRAGAAALPLAAIARAVEESAAMRSLAALVLDTCSGEGIRETGPWEFTLPLQAQGLGRSSLCLQLSRELLLLRFCCDGPDTRNLLSRHSVTLQNQLRERLEPPLEVEVVLSDA
jgi:Type III secretion protein (HpaP)